MVLNTFRRKLERQLEHTTRACYPTGVFSIVWSTWPSYLHNACNCFFFCESNGFVDLDDKSLWLDCPLKGSQLAYISVLLSKLWLIFHAAAVKCNVQQFAENIQIWGLSRIESFPPSQWSALILSWNTKTCWVRTSVPQPPFLHDQSSVHIILYTGVPLLWSIISSSQIKGQLVFPREVLAYFYRRRTPHYL